MSRDTRITWLARLSFISSVSVGVFGFIRLAGMWGYVTTGIFAVLFIGGFFLLTWLISRDAENFLEGS